jgi:hypothetical protein
MYGYVLRSQEPIQAYNALHKEVVDLVGTDDPEGLLVHIAYPTDQGYDMLEVWEAKDQLDAFNRDIVSQAFQRLGIPMDGPQPKVVEFEPVEVITPRAYTPASR